MYKLGINQNEKSNYNQKPNAIQERKRWLKFFSLLFIVIILFITTIVLIIANYQGSRIIDTNNFNNGNPNQNKNGQDYYKHNGPPNINLI